MTNIYDATLKITDKNMSNFMYALITTKSYITSYTDIISNMITISLAISDEKVSTFEYIANVLLNPTKIANK